MVYKLLIILLLSVPLALSAQEVDLLILNSEYDKALQIIDDELLVNDARAVLYLKKGIILQKRFDYAGAVKSLERALQLDSLNPNILSEIAEAQTSLGNHNGALPFYKRLYETDTTNVVKILKLVRAWMNLRNYNEPFKILNSVWLRDSTNLLINKQLALCAARTGHNDQSIRLYLKVLKQNPSDLANFTNLASVYQNKKLDDKVIETLEKGLVLFPDEPALLTRLGDYQYHLKEYPLAIIPYEKYLAKGDSAPEVMKNLGISYYFERRYREGLRLLERSLVINPEDPIVGLYIGLCYKSLRDLSKSIAYLKFASEIAIPVYLTDIYHHMGNVYRLKYEYTKSVQALKKAYELDSTNCTVLFEIATTYESMMNSETQAIKYYDAYLKSLKANNEEYRKLTKYALERKQVLKDELKSNKKITGKSP